MEINLTTQAVEQIACDALIVSAAHKTNAGIELASSATSVDAALAGLIHEISADGEFKGKSGELLTLHPAGKLAARRVIVVGLGAQETVTTQSVRRATAIAARHLQKTGARNIALAAGFVSPNFDAVQEAQAAAEGVLLGLYTFRSYQSSENAQITSVLFQTHEEQKEPVQQALFRAQVLAEATNFARSLINEPPCVLTPIELANRANAMAKEVGIACEIFDQAKIQELEMGGLLAVSKGSVNPPRFILLRYQGGARTDKGIAFVGKGITFDTGGISIKPAAGMDAMKGDMGGAAAVIGAMQAIGRLKPPINVMGIVPTCDNMPSGSAFVPGDIVRISNGKTIEIVNTDAEGRLVLADGLSFAVNEGCSPILDLATLTGSMVVALGHTMTGIFSNNEQLTQDVITAGQASGEKFWPMPLDAEYAEYIHSDIADIKQTGGREAGSVTAAKILENFVGSATWAHLDIAGTSYEDHAKAYQEKGGTGVGVRTLAQLAILLSQH